MDEQRMKENSVSLLHHQMHPVVVQLVVLDAMVHFVNPSLEYTGEDTFIFQVPPWPRLHHQSIGEARVLELPPRQQHV